MAKTNSDLPVVFLMGPTATGKTGLAVELHQYLPMDIVSVDSAMVYKGLDIGTAKPSQEVLEVAPHQLIDICDPVASYSAAKFCQDAVYEIEKIHARGRIPLLVGGTGLYFRALEDGLSVLPAADPDIRSRIEKDAEKHGWKKLHDKLAKIDPQAARRIDCNDPQRIQRALEVFEITGEPISNYYSRTKPDSPLDGKVIKIIVSPADRQLLHERIGIRFHDMLSKGLVDEVRQLRSQWKLHPGLPSMRIVGYRQVWQYLDGLLEYQQMINNAIVATRQLAKRQITWLKKEKNSQWIDSEQTGIFSILLKYIENRCKKTY